MLNYQNKILTKLISLILAQIFLLTCVAYPEAISNKDTSIIYIKDKTLRVPLDSPNDYKRMQEALSTTVNGQFLKENKGWQSRPEYAKWMQDVRNKILELRGAAIDVKVYYYAIGGGFSSQSSGVEDIDIVSPLIATDFTQLIGADVTQGDFEIFKRKIKKDLSSLQGIDLDGISFGRGVENIGGISYPVLTANFSYLGKSRKVKVYYNLDAAQIYPDELKNGYNILYSRGNPGLIRKMSEAVKSGLVNNLFKNNSFIVMENLPNSDLSFDGFNKVSLGDVSWAGVRKLDFYTNISKNTAGQALASNASLPLMTDTKGPRSSSVPAWLRMAPLSFMLLMPTSMISQTVQLNIPKDTMGVVQTRMATVSPDSIIIGTKDGVLDRFIQYDGKRTLFNIAEFKSSWRIEQDSKVANELSGAIMELAYVELMKAEPRLGGFIFYLDPGWAMLLAEPIRLAWQGAGQDTIDITGVFIKAAEIANQKIVQYPDLVKEAMSKNPQVKYLNEKFPETHFLDPHNRLADTNAVLIEQALRKVPANHIKGMEIFISESSSAGLASPYLSRIYVGLERRTDGYYKGQKDYLGLDGYEEVFTKVVIHELGHTFDGNVLNNNPKAKEAWLNLVKESGVHEDAGFECFANDYALKLMKGKVANFFVYPGFGNIDISKTAEKREDFFKKYVFTQLADVAQDTEINLAQREAELAKNSENETTAKNAVAHLKEIVLSNGTYAAEAFNSIASLIKSDNMYAYFSAVAALENIASKDSAHSLDAIKALENAVQYGNTPCLIAIGNLSASSKSRVAGQAREALKRLDRVDWIREPRDNRPGIFVTRYPGEDYFKKLLDSAGVKRVLAVTDSVEWDRVLTKYNKLEKVGGFFSYDSVLVGEVLYLNNVTADTLFIQEALAHETIHLLHHYSYGLSTVKDDYLDLKQSYIDSSKDKESAGKIFSAIEDIFMNGYAKRKRPLVSAAGEFFAWYYGLYITGQLERETPIDRNQIRKDIEKLIKEFHNTLDAETKAKLLQHYQNLGLPLLEKDAPHVLAVNAARGGMESLAKLDKLADNGSQSARDAFKNADLKDLISQLNYQFDKDKIRALAIFAVYGNSDAANFFAVLNPADCLENPALKEMFIQRDFKGLRTLIETITDAKILDQILLAIETSFIAQKSEIIQSEEASLIMLAIAIRHKELVSLTTVHALASALNKQKTSWVPYSTLKEIMEKRPELVSKRILWTLLNIFAKGEVGSWNRNVPKLVWDIAKNRPDLVSDTVIKEFTRSIFTVGKIRYLLPGIYVDAAEAIQELVKKRPQLRQDELINRLVQVPIGIIAQGGYEEYFPILSYINNTYPDFGSLAEKHSIALSAFRFLQRFGQLDLPSSDIIKEVVNVIIQQRKEYSDTEVFSSSTTVINIFHGFFSFYEKKTRELQENSGVDSSRISFFIGKDHKQAALASISNSKGPLTIYFNGHGSPYRFSLDDPKKITLAAPENVIDNAIAGVTEDFLLGEMITRILNPLTSIITGENANIFSISEKELAQALLNREKQGELSKVVIIFDDCFSYDFTINGLLRYLDAEGAKNFPIVITAANKDRENWGGVLLNALIDAQQDKQRETPLTVGVVFKAEKETIEKGFDTMTEDLGILVPFPAEVSEWLGQKLGLPAINRKYFLYLPIAVPMLEIGDATVPNQEQGDEKSLASFDSRLETSQEFSSDDLSSAPYSNSIHGPMISPAAENIGIADTPKTRQDVSMDSQISLLLDKARKGTKRSAVIDAVSRLYHLARSKNNIKAQDALISIAEEGENTAVNCVYLLASSGDDARFKEIVKTLYSPQLIEKAQKGDQAAAFRLSDLARLGNVKAQEELINLVREGKNNAVQPLCFVAVSKYGARAKEFLETLDLTQFVEQVKQESHKAIESLYFLDYYNTNANVQEALLKLFVTISGVKNHVYYDIADRILDIVINNKSFSELKIQELLDTIKTNFKNNFSRMEFEPGENSPEVMGIVSRAIDLFGSKAVKDSSGPIQEEFKRSPQRIFFYLSMPELVYPLLKAYQRSKPNKDIPFSYFVSAAFAEGYITYGLTLMYGEPMSFDVVGPMGLDSFGAQEKALKRKGFLPDDFQGFTRNDTTYTNEVGETYPNGTFASAEDALVAFMALLRESRARYLADVRSLGHKVEELSEDAIMVGTYLYYCTSNPKSYLKQYGINLKGVVGKYPRHGNGLFNSQWPAGTRKLLEKMIPEINSIGERNNDSGLLPDESENRLEDLESQLTTRDGLANQLDMYKLREAYFELIKQGRLSWSEITKRTERLHGAIAREILKDLQRDLAVEQDATEQALASNKALREAI